MSDPTRDETQISVDSTYRTSKDSVAGGVAMLRYEKQLVLDAAYDEYCQLRREGETIAASDFTARYPTYRKSLQRLIDVHETFEQLAGDSLDVDPWPQLDEQFLGFQIVAVLGVGATAKVYLATELALGRRRVVIKVSHFGEDEAETLGKLAHPNIVPVHSVQRDTSSGMTAVCMPYLGSSTLADVLEETYGRGQPVKLGRQILEALADRECLSGFAQQRCSDSPPDELLRQGSYVDAVVHWGIQLAEALEYTFRRGILHRDLKPSNVLVTPDGRPMLLDFNLSYDAQEDVRRMGGTLPYMPPEQIREVFFEPFGQIRSDARSDLFALGVMLYELLTGRLPFGDPPPLSDLKGAAEAYLEAQRRPPTPIRQINPEVDPALASTLHRCLALEVDERPQSPGLLADQLRGHFASAARLRRWAARRRRLLLAAAALALLSVAPIANHFATRPRLSQRAYLAGLALMNRHDQAAAIHWFDRSLEADPQGADARFMRGIAHLERDQFELAVADLQRAAAELQKSVVYECLAFANFQKREHSVAAYWYGQAAKTAVDNRDQARLLLNCANSLRRAGRQEFYVQQNVSAAISCNPQFQAAHHFRARLYLTPPTRKLLSLSLRQAIEDIENALAGHGTNWLLEFDAAHFYHLASRADPGNPIYAAKVDQHLTQAVAAGLPSILFRQRWLAAAISSPRRQSLSDRCEVEEDDARLDAFHSAPDLEQVCRDFAKLRS